ncbi:carbohydrate porin [Rhizobium tropici]|nr:carbohydrate porin [Rhizobium tropici]
MQHDKFTDNNLNCSSTMPAKRILRSALFLGAVAIIIPSQAFSQTVDQKQAGMNVVKKRERHALKVKSLVNNDEAAAAALKASSSSPAISAGDQALMQARSKTAARFDNYQIKGFNIPYPSYSDSLLQDYGSIRSKLDEYGIGIVGDVTAIGAYNLLDGPRSGPGPVMADGRQSDQQFWGQKLSGTNFLQAGLSFDTDRWWGVPDGQIVVMGVNTVSSWQNYNPNQTAVAAITWYQTLFDKSLELKFGIQTNEKEWVGTVIGGNIANPIGSSAAVHYEMGLGPVPAAQPSARLKWNITDNIYEQIGVMRSLPINGPTGNPIYDNRIYNPSNLDFDVPNGGLLAINEIGYKTAASPGVHSTWLRGGIMWNNSDFNNFATGRKQSGAVAGYLLGDYQLTQIAPDSIFSAYRGLYAGATMMMGDEDVLPFFASYEARLYGIGLMDSRPQDMISLSYTYNDISKSLGRQINSFSNLSGLFANSASQTAQLSYTAHVTDGVSATLGVGYTMNPSVTQRREDRNALNVILALFMPL